MKPDKLLESMVLWGAWNRPDVILYRMSDPIRMIAATRKSGEKTGTILGKAVPQQLDADGKPCGNPADFIGSFAINETFETVPLMVECKYVKALGPKENPFNLLSEVQRAERQRVMDAGWLYVLVLQVASKFYAIDMAPPSWTHLFRYEVQPKSREALNWLGPRAGLKSLPETWRTR